MWIIKPTSVVDEVSGLPLDPEKTWVGMQKEVAAMHSLGVGNVRSYQEIKAHCDETGAKIVKSRFVFTDKVDVDQQHIVRARLVTKDFAFNHLGIASQTASVDAFKAFICRVVQDTLVLWGLDVSTAFLYAKLEPRWLEGLRHPRESDLRPKVGRVIVAEAPCRFAC